MRREFYSENCHYMLTCCLSWVIVGLSWVIPTNANEAINVYVLSDIPRLGQIHRKSIAKFRQNSFYPLMLHLLHSNTRAQHFLLLRKRIREVYRLQLVFLLLFLFSFFAGRAMLHDMAGYPRSTLS